jgi:hypothetical protein
VIYLDKLKDKWIFKAFVENRENYYIVPLYNDEINEMTKELFLFLLNGKYEIELINNIELKNNHKIKKRNCFF